MTTVEYTRFQIFPHKANASRHLIQDYPLSIL